MTGPWIELSAVTATFMATTAFSYRRGLRYLHYFQQEDYNSGRFFNWLDRHSAFDQTASPWAAAAVAVSFFTLGVGSSVGSGNWLSSTLTWLAAAWIYQLALKEEDPRRVGKLPLNMTARAKRILRLTIILAGILNFSGGALLWAKVGSQCAFLFWIWQIVIYQLLPLFMIAANYLLDPYEKDLQQRFANHARQLFKDLGPTTIGITGSYGKTSTKVILSDVLNAVAPTFTTPRSINSYMGVTREIRERLKARHRFAVIEMGAYQTGSIKKMCSLTPPNAGIVTAVGQMHLERFGSQENVYKAKSELAEGVPKDGILVVNGDYEYCRQMAQTNKKRVTLIYGLDADKGTLDSVLYDIQVTEKGTTFAIKMHDQVYRGFTQVLGRPMLSNLLASFTMACALGLDPHLVLAVLRNVKTESNRLEAVRAPIASLSLANGKAPKEGSILRLNDAFNSNPSGFAGALEVLSSIKGARKILVTPGMVELGANQIEENKKAAQTAAAICDLVVVVGSTNREALVGGLKEGGLPAEKWKEVPTMKDAFIYLSNDYCSDGDVVLIENDLPDLYESVPKF